MMYVDERREWEQNSVMCSEKEPCCSRRVILLLLLNICSYYCSQHETGWMMLKSLLNLSHICRPSCTGQEGRFESNKPGEAMHRFTVRQDSDQRTKPKTVQKSGQKVKVSHITEHRCGGQKAGTKEKTF